MGKEYCRYIIFTIAWEPIMNAKMRAQGLLINLLQNLNGHVNMVIEGKQRCNNSTRLDNVYLLDLKQMEK